MKSLIIASFLLLTSQLLQANFQTIYVNGSASDFCSGGNFSSCSSNIKNRAQQQAQNSAQMYCSQRNGYLTSPYGFCQDNCTPSFADINQNFIYTTCTTNCQFTCSVQ